MKNKKEISAYGVEYLDEVVFDLIHFLNKKMDSKEVMNAGSSRLSYPRTTSLGKLYDKDQYIYFYGVEDKYDIQIHLLNNNKLLLISSCGPDYEFDLSTDYWFVMLSNASNYVLKTTDEDKGKKTFELDDGKGNVLKYTKPIMYYPQELPKEAPITSILKPLSFEQLYERGYVGTLKKEGKQRIKKQGK